MAPIDRKHFIGWAGRESGGVFQTENVPINISIKSRPGDLNERQRWFLGELRQGIKSTAGNIACRWKIALKTAKRDIADLKPHEMANLRGIEEMWPVCGA